MTNRIEFLRRKNGYNLDQLGELVGTSRDQIHNLEKEKRRLTHEWMRRIAKALECKASDLLPDDDFDARLDTAEMHLLRQFRTLSAPNQVRIMAIFEAGRSALIETEDAHGDGLQLVHNQSDC